MPEGYELLKELDLSEDAARMLSAQNLEGKQVFFFDVPKDFPFDTMQSLKLKNVLDGNVVATNSGTDYSFINQEKSGTMLYTLQEVPDGPSTFQPGRLRFSFSAI